MIRLMFILLVSCFLLGCEKELAISPRDGGDILAVEGSIENGQAPRIILTRSFNYFNTLSITDLANAFVKGAKVIVSDGTVSQQLKEYVVPFAAGDLVYYSTDTALGNNQLFGKFNTSYSLTIESAGKTYTANTTIPNIARTLDSVWWKPAPANEDTNKVVLFVRVTDPKGLGNYIRYYTSRNDSAFLPGINSVFDDAIIDGTSYEIQVDAGVDRNQDIDFDEYGFFARGDTIRAKLSNIDKTTFDFWRTWEQNQSNLGNPFGVPVKVLGNISNGALGYFGGYASQVETIIVPK
ncbi:MAG: DUF4249 domain-containing protein [Bacteroidota bacterium]